MHRITHRTHLQLPRRAHVAVMVGALALLVGSPAAAQGTQPVNVTCRVRDDVRGRVFSLRPAEPRGAAGSASWVLAMREAETKETWITLALPAAKPVVTPPTATLSYRNANGGRHVELSVSPAGSRLEVWVDHGLEVNIEPDLDPRVDRLNTDGALTNIDCTM